jgi:hypothetical protein
MVVTSRVLGVLGVPLIMVPDKYLSIFLNNFSKGFRPSYFFKKYACPFNGHDGTNTDLRCVDADHGGSGSRTPRKAMASRS